ncbi:MAG: tetratricopeptide repeat protein [Desulfobulbaceae bacterium]|nr:tetratricopeptide repeat protein [Desulfobulbaceae bacterium]
MVKLNFKYGFLIILLCALSLLVACGGPEAKKAKFFEKGKALYEQGDYVKARLELKNAIQIDLKYAEAYYYLGLTELKDGNPRKAYGALSKAVELNPDLLDAQQELGKLFLAGRAPDKALEKADLILAGQPENTDVLLLKSAALIRLEKQKEAEAILDGLLARGKADPQAYLLLASLYDGRGERQKAISMVEKGLAAHPDEPLFYTVLGKLAVQQKKTDEALGFFSKLMDLEPENLGHKLTLASLQWDLGKKDEAEALLHSLVGTSSEDEAPLLNVVRFYVSKNEFALAKDALLKGLKNHPQSFQLRFQLSELYLKEKDVDKAIAVLDECLTLDTDPAAPGILQAKILLARIYLARSEIDKADALTDDVLRENPKSVDAHFTKGSIYLLKGDGESAVPEFRVSVTERPQFIPGYISLSQAHFMNKEIELGGETLIKGMKANPDSREILQRLIRYYQLKKDGEAIEDLLNEFIAKHPDDVEVRAVLGDFYVSRDRKEDALAEYEKIVTQAPENPLGYKRIGNLHWKNGEKKEAVAILEKGYEANVSSLDLAGSLVQAYLLGDQPGKAIALCEERLARNSKDAFAYNMMGTIYLKQKNFEAAEQSFSKAIELQPEWLTPHNSLAALYVIKGEPAEAVKKFEKAIEVNPQRGETYISLAMLHEKMGEYDKAIAVYETMLARDAKFWPAANNLAFLLAEYKASPENLERALSLVQQAQKVKPNQPEILDTLGWIYLKKGNMQSAIDILEKALALAPSSPVLNFHLGYVLAQSGRADEASQYLRDAVNSGQNFPGIDKAREELQKLGK